jgi:hypothetical protein
MRLEFSEFVADNGKRFKLPVTDDAGNDAIRLGATRCMVGFRKSDPADVVEAIKMLLECEYRFEVVPHPTPNNSDFRVIELLIVAPPHLVDVLRYKSNEASGLMQTSILAFVQVFWTSRVVAKTG